jgi:hypothetical protein
MSKTMTETSLDADADRLREECGVFGIFGHPDVAAITALGLAARSNKARAKNNKGEIGRDVEPKTGRGRTRLAVSPRTQCELH